MYVCCMTYVGMSPIDICLEIAAPWYNCNSSSSSSSSSSSRVFVGREDLPLQTCNGRKQHGIPFRGVCSTRENQSIGLRWSVVIPGVYIPVFEKDGTWLLRETSSSSLWVGEGGLQAYMAQLLECGNWGERGKKGRGEQVKLLLFEMLAGRKACIY